jgi:antitoxin (DNA-binding transcriptional repressor) of toxin-antitoxin stability system
MDKNGWNVGEAKQQFSEVLRRSATEPQLIYRRDQLIAAVVAMDEKSVAAVSKRPTIADRFEEARELFRQENYQLPQTRRRSRPNSFVRALNEVARRHERSK